MNRFEPLEKPLAFLGSFCVAAILLLPVWVYTSRFYMAASIGLVNACSHWMDLPPAFQLPYPAGGAITNPSTVALAALFIATPRRSLRWKASWIAGAILFFWILQSLLLLLQVYLAFSHATAPAVTAAHRLEHAGRALLPAERGCYLNALPELSERWAVPVLSLFSWYIAAQTRWGRVSGEPPQPEA